MQGLSSALPSPEERFDGKKSCQNPCINISHFPALKDCLPDYRYHVCEFETLSKTVDHVNFRATLRMALSSEAEIKEWLKSHSVTWRVERTHKTTQQKVLFKVNYRCQHYQPKRGKENVPNNLVPVKSKNTNCPAKMTIKLARTEVSRGRQSLTSDPHLPAFPTMVCICSNHNHNIYVAEALSYGDVGEGAREKLIRFMEAGHSPSYALDLLKLNLQEEHGDNYLVAAANKELCPTLEFCYRLYQQIFLQQYGSSLERKVEEYNSECKDQCAKAMTTFSGKQLVAICSPLMKRVHMHLKHSGEMCFMDAVVILHRISSSNFLPQTAAQKAELHYIATGVHHPVQFFQPLREETVLQLDTVADLNVANEGGREDTVEEVMVAEDVAEEVASEDASHEAAAGLTAMYEDMLDKVSSDSSLAVAVVAAVKAYQRIQNNPAKLSTAWHMFGRYNNTRLASVRSTAIRRAARHAGPAIHAQPTALSRRKVRLGGKRRLNAGRPVKVMTGPDHVYSQPSKRV